MVHEHATELIKIQPSVELTSNVKTVFHSRYMKEST